MLAGSALLLSCPLLADDFDFLASIPLSGLDPVASNPYGVTFHPSAPLFYVALAGEIAFFPDPPESFNGSTVAELDMATLEVTRLFETGLFPTEITISADGLELFVTSSTSNSLTRVDLDTGSSVEIPLVDEQGIPVGFPSGVALSPDQSQIWVTSNGGDLDGSDENLIVLDRATGGLLFGVEIAGGLSRFAVREDGLVVVPVGFPDGDFTAPPQVRIFDSTAGWQQLVSLSLVVDTADFPAPTDVALSPDGSRAYVTVFGGSSEIFVIDLVALELLPPISLPGDDFLQHGLGIDPAGDFLIVAELPSDRLRVIELATGTVIASIDAAGGPNEVGIGGGRAWITEQSAVVVTVLELPGSFLRGDANGDGTIDLADGIQILGYLFLQQDLACPESADIDDGGEIDLADAIALFEYIFLSGSPPAYPFPLPGGDLGERFLGCS